MNRTWVIAVILFLALSLPLVVYLTQQSQEIRQRAQVPYPSASPQPSPQYGGSATICTWYRSHYDPYYLICETPESGNGNDGIGKLNNSSTADLGLCQEKQDDRQYCFNCNTCDGGVTKIISWTSKGPRGTTCTYTCDFCNIVNNKPTCTHSGSQLGACSTTELNPPPPPTNFLQWQWNFNECAKCTGGANATWSPTGSVTINSITAQNYRPLLEPFDTSAEGSPNDTRVKTATGGFDTRSKLDFRIQIIEKTSPSDPGTVIRTVTIPSTDTRISCAYATPDSYSARDAANHRVDCTLGGYTISGMTFVPGRIYNLKTWVKLGYVADESGWVDYVADAQGNINTNICNSSYSVPTSSPSPTPRPSPSPSPTPSPSPMVMCQARKLYTLTGPITDPASWNLISDSLSEMQALRPGDVVYATIIGSAVNSTIDKARIRMNPTVGQAWTAADETVLIKPASTPTEYYKQFTIPTGTINFRFEGEVHDTVTQRWY